MLHTATCLATPLQHMLHRKLHRETLTVELDPTIRDNCRDFLKPLLAVARDCKCIFEIIASYSLRLQRVTDLLQLAMGFFPTLRDKLQGKLHLATPA